MLGELTRGQRQCGQRIGSADNALVGDFSADRLRAQAFGGGDDAGFDALQAAVGVKRFTFVGNEVVEMAGIDLVDMEADDYDGSFRLCSRYLFYSCLRPF